jgi:hypothetical protein
LKDCDVAVDEERFVTTGREGVRRLRKSKPSLAGRGTTTAANA